MSVLVTETLKCSAFYNNRTELFISQFQPSDNGKQLTLCSSLGDNDCCEGNYTCSGQTSLASVDYTVLVTTENLLFPLRAPEDVTTTEGHSVTDYSLSSLYLGEEMSD